MLVVPSDMKGIRFPFTSNSDNVSARYRDESEEPVHNTYAAESCPFATPSGTPAPPAGNVGSNIGLGRHAAQDPMRVAADRLCQAIGTGLGCVQPWCGFVFQLL